MEAEVHAMATWPRDPAGEGLYGVDERGMPQRWTMHPEVVPVDEVARLDYMDEFLTAYLEIDSADL